MKHTAVFRRLATVLALVAAMLCLFCGAASAGGLAVHFLDIGRNDGILIECDGETAFIDTGAYPYGEQAVDYLRSVGVSHLRYYIGTHAHEDHVGGASKLILAMSPDSVLQPHSGVRDQILRRAWAKEERAAVLDATFVNVAVGEVYPLGGARITIISPARIARCSDRSGLENNNSIVMRLDYGSTSFLFTGDCPNTLMEELDRQNPGALNCDVLKNAHHGAGITPEVLAACSPEYVVFSTSDRSLPAKKTLKRVSECGATMLITAPGQNSTVVVRSDGRSLSYSTARSPASIAFSESAYSVYEGKQLTVKTRLDPSGYVGVTYSSKDESVATVDGLGVVTGVKPGRAVIRASTVNGVNAEAVVNVLPATVVLSSDTLSVRHYGSRTLRYTLMPRDTRVRTVAWSSDDPRVATVSSRGVVSGVMPGETTVRATLANGSQAACRVTVTPIPASSVKISPGSPKITIGQTQQLTAAVGPKNATDKSVTWSSEDESVARVDQNGLVTAVGVGRARITAETANGKSRSLSVTVKPVYITNITLSSDRDTLTEGVAGKNTLRLHAAIQPLNATIQDIEWKSSNPRVATVDGTGLVTAVSRGRVTIYAVSQDGSRRKGSFRVNVTANAFSRNAAVVEPGRLTVSAKQLAYERDCLKVVLYYANQTDQAVPRPAGGVLTFILPDGRRLAVMPMEVGSRTVRRGAVSTVTLKLPLANYPQLAGLDLAACDATVTG